MCLPKMLALEEETLSLNRGESKRERENESQRERDKEHVRKRDIEPKPERDGGTAA